MSRAKRWSVVFSLFLGFPLWSCGSDEGAGNASASGGQAGSGGNTGGSGGDSGAGAGGTAGSGGCTVISPVDTSIYFASVGAFGVSATVDLPLAGYAKTRLNLELYDEGSGLPPGTFDLSLPPDDSYATCEHCVLLVAYDAAGQTRRVFFQKSGTMDLEKFELIDALVGVGSVSSVKLVEVIQEPDFSWHEVQNGLCFEVPSWSFDTDPVDGGACDTAEDCPNEAVQVCDVETKKCVKTECNLTFDPPFCDEGQRCMSQAGPFIDRDEGGPAAGACYQDCTPGNDAACGAGKTCFPLGPTQAVGVCLETGGPEVGEACAPSDLTTGCAPGAYCSGEPGQCLKTCNYLSSGSGCPSGTYCSSLNLCEPLGSGDQAPVGAVCAETSPLLLDCGPEGDAFRGLCIDYFPESQTRTCERICKISSPACGTGQTCVPIFSNPDIGVCHTPGTCGDLELDLLMSEVCDDGNSESGDGCSADCKTAELDVLCTKADPLALGINFDSNEHGVTGYTSLCDPYNASPTKTYAFQPASPGKLTLELESAADLGVSVLADCADPTSELACQNLPGTDKLSVNFESVPQKPVLVVVRSAYPLVSGLFALSAGFVPQVCGDGQVGGTEECDDGNTTGNDGCSADCSSIEWATLCSALPALVLGTKVQGNVDGGSLFFDTSGFCAYQSGPERAYQFTATSAGTLQLSLESDQNLNIAVLDGCGPVDPGTNLLSCANSGQSGESEKIDVPVTAGKKLTIVVQGHSTEDGGAFALEAKLLP